MTNGIKMPGPDLEDNLSFDPETDDFQHRSLTKERHYRHFDDPISDEERKGGCALNELDINHRFFPLLGFTDTKRRVFRDNDGKLKTKLKPRSIRYASHRDAAYLQAYSEYLSIKYERALQESHLEDCILAYRPIGKTNVHHAKSLFDEIRARKNCHVVALDISGFFDSLDHAHLKHELLSLFDVDKLTSHDWTVYRNVTRYSWVETADIDAVLGKKRRRGNRICSPVHFAKHIRGSQTGLVRTHDLTCGIPQGTPVSGLYANIYMLSFDQDITELMESLGGSYRRYSDDIALVVPHNTDVSELVHVVQKLLADYFLSLSEDKTDHSRFEGPKLTCDHPIQYLGFVFDGRSTQIRKSSLLRYRMKMQKGIHAKLVAAKQQNIPSSHVFRREALARYTHLGKRRNFLKYAYQAADILDAPEIRQQVKRHMTWFKRTWKREITRVYRR